jgi:hypothetical protein
MHTCIHKHELTICVHNVRLPHIHTYTHTHTYIHTYIYTGIPRRQGFPSGQKSCPQSCIHTCMHACKHNMHTCMHTYINMNLKSVCIVQMHGEAATMHTYMHTYIHTYIVCRCTEKRPLCILWWPNPEERAHPQFHVWSSGPGQYVCMCVCTVY